MANEELRGEYQDPRLIGISSPSNTMGLGGNAGAMPTASGIPAVPPPYVGGPTKIFDTLPINGRRFEYDMVIFGGNSLKGDGAEIDPPTVLTAKFPLLGPNCPQQGTVFHNTYPASIGAGSVTGVQTRGTFTTLVTHYAGKLFINGQPMALNTGSFNIDPTQNSSQQFDVSGTVLSEYIFNAGDTDGFQPVFIPLASTDTFSALLRLNFGNGDLPLYPELFDLALYVRIQGVLLLDNGLAKELQVSL